MSDPQIKQSTPIAVLRSGEEVKFSAEWIRILNRLSGTSSTSSSTGDGGVLTDLLSRVVALETENTALKARVALLEGGYQV